MLTRFLSTIGAFTLLAAVLFGLSALARPESTAVAQPASAAKPTVPPPTPSPLPATYSGQWRCDYYTNRDFAGRPAFTEVRPSPNFTVRASDMPAGLPSDNFAVRCISRQPFALLDNYIFHVKALGAVRLIVDDRVLMNEWYVGAHDARANVALRDGSHTLVIEFYDDIGRSSLSLDWQVGCNAWDGRFYNNPNFQAPIATKRCDGEKNGPLIIDVGAGELAADLAKDNVSAMWEQDVAFKAGTYLFTVDVDDAVQISIDRGTPFDNHGQADTYTFTRTMSAGRHHIQVLFVEHSDKAHIKLTWEQTS